MYGNRFENLLDRAVTVFTNSGGQKGAARDAWAKEVYSELTIALLATPCDDRPRLLKLFFERLATGRKADYVPRGIAARLGAFLPTVFKQCNMEGKPITITPGLWRLLFDRLPNISFFKLTPYMDAAALATAAPELYMHAFNLLRATKDATEEEQATYLGYAGAHLYDLPTLYYARKLGFNKLYRILRLGKHSLYDKLQLHALLAAITGATERLVKFNLQTIVDTLHYLYTELARDPRPDLLTFDQEVAVWLQRYCYSYGYPIVFGGKEPILRNAVTKEDAIATVFTIGRNKLFENLMVNPNHSMVDFPPVLRRIFMAHSPYIAWVNVQADPEGRTPADFLLGGYELIANGQTTFLIEPDVFARAMVEALRDYMTTTPMNAWDDLLLAMGVLYKEEVAIDRNATRTFVYVHPDKLTSLIYWLYRGLRALDTTGRYDYFAGLAKKYRLPATRLGNIVLGLHQALQNGRIGYSLRAA